MPLRRTMVTGLMLTVWAAAGGNGLAQTRTIPDAECKALRDRLTEHAKLSDGVRRALAAQAARYPAPPPPPAPAAAAPAAAPAPGRAEAIRGRLAQLPAERRRLEDERNSALLRFEIARATSLQGQMSALDAEKDNLERELASLPAAPAGPAPALQAPPPPPAPPVLQPVSDVDRIPCQDIPPAYESAVRTRQRELGAREGQAGAVPLTALKGQSLDQIARELGAQFAAWPQAATQVGLLDQDGDGRLDGFVDVPAPNVFRLYRQRPDGMVGVDLFAVLAPGTTPAYDEMTRRLEEAALRQTRRTPVDLLASRPAGPLRVLGEIGEFAKAMGFALAGNFAEAARVEGGGARSVEFQNYRGDTLRALEVIAPVTGGFAWHRLVVFPLPNNEELWQESVVLVKPTSYWRTDAEVRGSTERRTAAGPMAGSRSGIGPFTFGVDR